MAAPGSQSGGDPAIHAIGRIADRQRTARGRNHHPCNSLRQAFAKPDSSLKRRCVDGRHKAAQGRP
jgi:hypothetical protein